ncbi:MAG: outer-membrane lipoprotein carrier protein LolA [Phycisphaerales bacterium]|nr:outer-membrane lipoprotein carrier protein LolA [Phycisphaerales bacterium]
MSRCVTAVMALSLATTSAAAAVLPDGPTVELFLAELEEEYQRIQALSYRFEQVQRMPELTSEIALSGSVLHQRPAELRIEVRGDESFDLLSDGRSVWWIDNELGKVDELSLAAFRDAPVARLLPPLLLESPANWRRSLRVVAFEDAGSGRRLVLEPLQAGGRFENLALVFRGLRLQRSIVRYGENDEVITDYSNWRRLGAVSHTLFRYQLEPRP